MIRGWALVSHFPPVAFTEAGSLLREAVIERGAQQVVEQQDGPAPQLQPLPPSQALPVTQEAQTGVKREHDQGQQQEEQGPLPAQVRTGLQQEARQGEWSPQAGPGSPGHVDHTRQKPGCP